MADIFLLESSLVDGYLLEDGTGVLLLEQDIEEISGTIAGTSSTSGSLIGTGRLVSVVNGVATTSGTMVGSGTLAGTSAGVATVTGDIDGSGALAGSTAGTSTVQGSLEGIGGLEGSSDGTSTTSGTIVGIGNMSGLSQGTSLVQGVLTGEGEPEEEVPVVTGRGWRIAELKEEKMNDDDEALLIVKLFTKCVLEST